jgi:hypothetical protein
MDLIDLIDEYMDARAEWLALKERVRQEYIDWERYREYENYYATRNKLSDALEALKPGVEK